MNASKEIKEKGQKGLQRPL